MMRPMQRTLVTAVAVIASRRTEPQVIRAVDNVRAQTRQLPSKEDFLAQRESPQNSSWKPEVRCTPELVRKIDGAGKARRTNSNATPYYRSPSQLLRVIGNSVALEQQRIKRVERRGDVVIIEYESFSGTPGREERLVASFSTCRYGCIWGAQTARPNTRSEGEVYPPDRLRSR